VTRIFENIITDSTEESGAGKNFPATIFSFGYLEQFFQ
jgi:hypothetical protein